MPSIIEFDFFILLYVSIPLSAVLYPIKSSVSELYKKYKKSDTTGTHLLQRIYEILSWCVKKEKNITHKVAIFSLKQDCQRIINIK